MVHLLKYGNTNTYFIDDGEGLLVDTDFAGTLPQFFREIKKANILLKNIKYAIATHYHPDHIGIISELMGLGVKLLIVESQVQHIHYSDKIFARISQLKYQPVDIDKATILSFNESRTFLQSIGIAGEIFSTTSHSEDGIGIILDHGECFIGDVEPLAYLNGYEDNLLLKEDWKKILSYNPKIIYHAHANKKIL